MSAEKKSTMLEVFLDACVPVMEKVLAATFRKGCDGCRDWKEKDKDHSCQRQVKCFGLFGPDYEFQTVKQAASYMITNVEEIFQEMKLLLTGKLNSHITLQDFMHFMSPFREHFPLYRLCNEDLWIIYIQKKINDKKPIHLRYELAENEIYENMIYD
jgi:hypothetical protein